MPNSSYTPNTNEQPDTDADRPMFSRTGASDIFGKLDEELPPIRINGDALDAIKRKAREVGMNLSEYVRTRLYVDAFGVDHVTSLYEDRIRRVIGNASPTPSEGPEA